jgi:hypothetical protein
LVNTESTQRPIAVAFLKSKAREDVLDIVKRVETMANDCWRALDIRNFASNVASWGVLVGGVQEVERQLAVEFKHVVHHAALMSRDQGA